MASTKSEVSIVIPEHAAYLNVVRQAVASTAALMGFDGSTVMQLQMAVDEACANVIEHGAPLPVSRTLKLQIQTDGEKIVVQLQDRCKRFSPLEQGSLQLDDYFKSSRNKGLGLIILRAFVDDVRHSYRSRTGNRLVLTKYLRKQPLTGTMPSMMAP